MFQESAESLGKQRKKKCLCLSIWLIGLILLTIGAIVMAYFLIPEESSLSKFQQVQACPDLLPLEDKVKNSEVIVVASMVEKLTLEIQQILKGNIDSSKYLKLQQGLCLTENFAESSVFFLTAERKGRSLENKQLYIAQFQSILASEKVIEVVELLLDEKLTSTENLIQGKLVSLFGILFEQGRCSDS